MNAIRSSSAKKPKLLIGTAGASAESGARKSFLLDSARGINTSRKISTTPTSIERERRNKTEKFASTLRGGDVVDETTGVSEVEFKLNQRKLNPEKVYRFQCDGIVSLVSKKRKNKKKIVKEIRYRSEFSGSVEEFIYPSLRPTEENLANRPVDFAIVESDNTPPAYTLQWKLDVRDLPPSSDVDHRTTVFQEKGENTLREVLRKKYRDRGKEKTVASVEDEIALSRNSRKKNLLSTMFSKRLLDETPQDIYCRLAEKGKAEAVAKTVRKLVAMTPLERIHAEKAAALTDTDQSAGGPQSGGPGQEGGVNFSEHKAGLLYYQIRNELSQKKNNTGVSFNVEAGKSSSPARPVSLLDRGRVAARSKKTYVSSINKRQLHYSLSRGVSLDVMEDHELKTEESLRAMRELSEASSQLYSCNALSQVRRAHLAVLNGHSIEEDQSVEDMSLSQQKTYAQDVLLERELRRGVIPEKLLKKIPRMGDLVCLDLSHYSLGDDMCICLGHSMGVLEILHTLGLRSNRLTHKSLEVVFTNVSKISLRHLDISMNDVSGPSMDALCDLLRHSKCKLSTLELSKTCIMWQDVKKISEAIMSHEFSFLTELTLAQNKLDIHAIQDIVNLLKYEGCALSWLDLSWNEFNSVSGENLAKALEVNRSLTALDLSSNALRDEGGQHIAACLLSNRSLQEIYLSLNNIGGKSCFIFSKVLRGHPSMKRLNLSDNPLTEAGARSIFRTILRGLRCFVMMQSCTFNSENVLFKHSNPSLDSPYTLNLVKPYEVSILSELINMVNTSSNTCTFRNINYKATEKDKGLDIVAEYMDGDTYLRHGSNPWSIPSTGLLTVHFMHQMSIPTEEMAIDQTAFDIILAIVVNARSENDRKNWLFLLCMDAYFTTAQAQDLIDILDDRRFLGPGGISLVEFFVCFWSNIIDTQNIYDFMYENLQDPNERISLMHSLSFEKFKFNWINPTGHWRLDLSNRAQRAVMMQLIALNIVESKASKRSKRGDTSQKGNWCNFRNERMNGAPCEIDIDYSKNLPWRGVLEFDYVSTTRPPLNAQTITDDEFSEFLHKLDLTTRRRLDISKVGVKLMELQLAVTKYYFETNHVVNLLDCFSEDDSTQARVVIILFSRIYDLFNFECVLRHVTAASAQDIFERLGVLNCINPLKPSHNLKLNMRHMDNRILAHTFFSMSSYENGDQLKQHPRSEVDIIALYAQLGRIITDDSNNDKLLMFTYCEIGERQSEVAWNYRQDMCQKFLIGTKPWDTSMFKIIKMYKEIVAAKALVVGAIDLQYKEFLRNKNSRRGGPKGLQKSSSVVNKLKSETMASRNRSKSEEDEEEISNNVANILVDSIFDDGYSNNHDQLGSYSGSAYNLEESEQQKEGHDRTKNVELEDLNRRLSDASSDFEDDINYFDPRLSSRDANDNNDQPRSFSDTYNNKSEDDFDDFH